MTSSPGGIVTAPDKRGKAHNSSLPSAVIRNGPSTRKYADFRHVNRKDDLPQTRAVLERLRTNLFSSLSDISFGEVLPAGYHTLPHIDDFIVLLLLRQPRRPGKRIAPNLCHTIRDGQTGQTRTIAEGFCADLGQAVG